MKKQSLGIKSRLEAIERGLLMLNFKMNFFETKLQKIQQMVSPNNLGPTNETEIKALAKLLKT